MHAAAGGPTLLWSAREAPEHDRACRGEVGEQANERAPEKRWFSAFPFFLSPPETRESPVGRRALRNDILDASVAAGLVPKHQF